MLKSVLLGRLLPTELSKRPDGLLSMEFLWLSWHVGTSHSSKKGKQLLITVYLFGPLLGAPQSTWPQVGIWKTDAGGWLISPS